MPKNDLIQEVKPFFNDIMSILFSVGAFVGYDTEINMEKLDEFVKKLENKIDWFEAYNGELKNFILPTGTSCSAYCHVCRTVCRRVERRLYDVPKAGGSEVVVRFFNRLSDFLFSVSRTCNSLGGGKEIVWQDCL
jgi:cob(I)alamin adenosyltransferase